MMQDDFMKQISSPLRAQDARTESQLMEKIAVLQREFSDIDADHNQYISRDELYTYLDRKSGKAFDRAIANEIFDHMDKNHDNMITINEFIKVYIEADEILRKKIETAKINREYYKKQEEDCLKKAEEAKLNERFTAYGITQNSIVHVVIIESKSLKPSGFTGTSSTYVEASLDRQQVAKTKAIPGIEPIWNEKFTFEVVNPDGQLRFAIYDQSRIREDFEGEVILHLKELRDQNIHDVWLDLFEKSGYKGRGQLHVKLQWIHSKTKYYAMVAQKWHENFVKEEEELAEYARYIESLHMPFQGLKNMAKIEAEGKVYGDFHGLGDLDKQFITLMNKAAGVVANEANPSEGFWKRLTTLGCLIEIVIAIFLMFGRPAFFDVMIPIVLMLYVHHDVLRDIISVRIFSFIILGSVLILDVGWLGVYSGNWTEGKDAQVENGTRSFVVFLSYINILVKSLLAAICYMLNIQLFKQRGSVPRIVMREVDRTVREPAMV